MQVAKEESGEGFLVAIFQQPSGKNFHSFMKP